MSTDNYNSFWSEMQHKYKISAMHYTPPFFAYPGLRVALEANDSEERQGCPICGKRPNIHEYKKRTAKFGTLNGAPVIFEFNRVRYICNDCQITFMDELDHLLDYQRMTTDAENYIISKLGSQTFTDIAVEIGVSVQTIANRANSFGAAERGVQLSGRYSYLSMDEVFVSRDRNGDPIYYWLLNDISHPGKSNNIQVDEGRKKEDVIKRLSELGNPETIRAICIDMWKPYRDAILEAFPARCNRYR